MMHEALCRLTPAFAGHWEGSVHSVFERVVNLRLGREGDMRILSLTLPQLSPLPDSVCLPREELTCRTPGEKALLDTDKLQIGSETFVLCRDGRFCGRIPSKNGTARLQEMLQLCTGMPNGFDRLPPTIRRKADDALCTGEWQSYLGLGGGLTPSFDDACVGMMAVFSAAGVQFPHLTNYDATTDISARYLRLAQEGYWGQCVVDVVDALWDAQKNLQAAVTALAAVGATSGADMLYGMQVALALLSEKGHGVFGNPS